MQIYENEVERRAASNYAEKEVRIPPIRTESGCEYILPDYMGEIKKLLMITATPIPAGKYERDGGGSYSGVVEYRVHYYDKDGVLSCSEFTSDYEIEAKTQFAPIDSYIRTYADTCSVRVQGPRKLSVKCMLISEVALLCEDAIPAPDTVGGLECRREELKVHRAAYYSSGEREYAEEGECIEGIPSDEVQILSHSACASVNGVSRDRSILTVSGEICAAALLNAQDGGVIRSECRIPFENRIEGVKDGSCDHVKVDAAITSIHSSLNDKTDSDGVAIGAVPVFAVTLELFVRTDGGERVSVITDAFSTESEAKVEYTDYEYSEPIGCGIKRQNLAFKSELGTNCTPLSVLSASVTPRSLSYIPYDGGIKITGECEMITLVCAEGDEPYVTLRNREPFEISVPVEGCASDEDYEIVGSVKLGAALPVISGESIHTDCAMDADVCILKKKSVRAVSSVGYETTEKEPYAFGITVCYPDNGNTLWDIAKRYRASPSRLARDNALPESVISEPWAKDSLDGVSYLMIPVI